METTNNTSWRIKAHNLETCNCSHGCGCQFAGFPDYGSCEAILGYETIEGHYGDVDLEGVKFVLAAKWPKAIHEGNGKAILFVDEASSASQTEAIVKIITGQEGGMPWEALAATLTEFEGPVLKPIELTVDGNRSRFRISETLEVNMTPLMNPVSGEEQDVHIVYPKGGFIWNDGAVCTTETMRIDYGGLNYEYPGKFSVLAMVDWTNQN